jgi:Flp pilus assembly protein TadG
VRPPARRSSPPSRFRRAAVGRGPGRDCGAVTLEVVVLFPLLLTAIFGAVQGALYLHGRNVALAAAEEGVRAARLDGAARTAAAATAGSQSFLDAVYETDNFSDLVITPTVTREQVRVTVTARTLSLLPGVPGPRVSQTAAGPVERFTSRTSP